MVWWNSICHGYSLHSVKTVVWCALSLINFIFIYPIWHYNTLIYYIFAFLYCCFKIIFISNYHIFFFRQHGFWQFALVNGNVFYFLIQIVYLVLNGVLKSFICFLFINVMKEFNISFSINNWPQLFAIKKLWKSFLHFIVLFEIKFNFFINACFNLAIHLCIILF